MVVCLGWLVLWVLGGGLRCCLVLIVGIWWFGFSLPVSGCCMLGFGLLVVVVDLLSVAACGLGDL